MNDLLTAAEYAAIAETLSFSGNAFIDGAFRPAASGKTFPTLNPATGKVLTEVAACDAADVDLAVAKAKGPSTTAAGGCSPRASGRRSCSGSRS
jgi:gamma-glutamyl-gamma-aminobutyraldehyde dehydrogenase